MKNFSFNKDKWQEKLNINLSLQIFSQNITWGENYSTAGH